MLIAFGCTEHKLYLRSENKVTLRPDHHRVMDDLVSVTNFVLYLLSLLKFVFHKLISGYAFSVARRDKLTAVDDIEQNKMI